MESEATGNQERAGNDQQQRDNEIHSSTEDDCSEGNEVGGAGARNVTKPCPANANQAAATTMAMEFRIVASEPKAFGKGEIARARCLAHW